MKWVFFLLLLVNLGLAGYGYLQQTRLYPDANIVDFQMNADKVRIISEPVVVKPKRTSLEPTACLEWGSFGDLELRRVTEALSSMDLADRISVRKEDVTTGWWVYMPPQGSQANMDRKAQELVDLGVTDFVKVTENGPWRYAISLGAFGKEEGARAYLAELQDRGVRTAEAGRRNQRVMQTTLMIRSPTPSESTQLVELATRFPGTDLRASGC